MSTPTLADPQQSYALLVGVHRYNSLESLPAVEKNLTGLADLLCAPDVWGLPPSHCLTVPQPDNPNRVLDMLTNVARRATDTLLVYYAGHGLLDPQDNDLHLSLVGSDSYRVQSTSLPFAWVRREILEPEVRARHKVVILDCCWSGRAMEGWMSGGQSVAEQLADHSRIDGACLLTSVAETKKAKAEPGEDFTAFTGELITLLRDGIEEGPALLDLETVYAHTYKQLRAKNRPLPRIRSLNMGGKVALARNRGYAPPPPPPPPAPEPSPAQAPLPEPAAPPAPVPEPVPAQAPEPSAAPAPSSSPRALPRPRSEDVLTEPAPAEPEPVVDEQQSAPVRIGLWGAPASGKTTLLAALAHVVGDTQAEYGTWRISGTDRVSEQFLVRHKTGLMNDGQFPSATEAVGQPLRFRFTGGQSHPVNRTVDFVVEVQDVPGEFFHDRSVAPDNPVVARLAESDALVYLFDPIDAASHASADYLFGLIQRLTTHLEETGRVTGRYLPHCLAVCVTKFDAPQVFLAARAARWGTQGDDRYRFPRVKDEHARDFLHWAARHFAGNAGRRVCDLIENHFDPARTRYFVTSAIGFHVGPDGVFRSSDFVNTDALGGIRSGIRPVNVLEPFIALQRMVPQYHPAEAGAARGDGPAGGT
ncbi:caspase, EACC1-associated type [Streptomyces sp. NPDC002676]